MSSTSAGLVKLLRSTTIWRVVIFSAANSRWRRSGLAAFGLYPGLEPLNGKDLGESVDSVNMLDLYYGLESEGPNSTLLRRATEVFGDSKAAIEWLNEEIPSLGGRKPLDLFAGSEEDKERVYTILGRIEAGVF